MSEKHEPAAVGSSPADEPSAQPIQTGQGRHAAAEESERALLTAKEAALPGKGLGGQVARGASVVLIGQATRVVMQVGSVTVLARLLTPIDYGLIATVLTVVGVGEIFRDFGLSTAAIQAKHVSAAQRDSLLWLNASIGIGLALLVFLAAPGVAAVFGQPQLTALTRVLSLTFVVNGFAAQYRADLNRRMKFGSLVASDVLAQAAGIAVAIICAGLGAGYWALAIQQLTQVLTTLLILTSRARWLPGRPRRGADITMMVRYGRNLMATQLLSYMNNNVDTVTIALRLGPAPLGVYNRGYQLLMAPLNQLRSPSTTVALPALAKLQDDPKRAGEYIKRGQLALGYTLVAGLSFAGGAAEPLVRVFLGDQWSGVGLIFSILAAAGAFQTLSYVGSWVYLSRGLTADLFRYTLVSLSIKIVCVLVGSTWGIVGVAAGFAVAPGISWPISLWWLSRRTYLPVRDLWFGAFRILGCAVAGAAACLTAVIVTRHLPDLVQLGVGLLAVLVVYAVAAVVFSRVRKDISDVVHIARKAVGR